MENAFIHGLEEKNGNSTIKISGILNDEEETVLFMIHDNGVGMTRAQIEKALDPPPGTKGSFDFPVSTNGSSFCMERILA